MVELIQGVSQFLMSVFAAGSIQTSAELNQLQQAELPLQQRIPGGVAIIPIGYGLKQPKASFNGHQVMVLRPDEQKPWQAVVGIPLGQTPGNAVIKVGNKSYRFDVKDFPYKEQRLTVNSKHVSLSKDNLQRVRREKEQIVEAFKTFSNEHSYSPLAWPLVGQISSPFGLKRFFNDKPRKPHSGLDVAAATGTPILAPADGKVILTGDFFFNGNSVFIDHGQGLVSMYCHLNSIEVTQSERVTAGDRLGTVGATGRVTGPHLHWSVSLNNARVNPLLLMAPLQGVASNAEKEG